MGSFRLKNLSFAVVAGGAGVVVVAVVEGVAVAADEGVGFATFHPSVT